jgi:hypothetical protein
MKSARRKNAAEQQSIREAHMYQRIVLRSRLGTCQVLERKTRFVFTIKVRDASKSDALSLFSADAIAIL